MKLNKYIYKKIAERYGLGDTPYTPAEGLISENEIEEWIVDWYKDIYERLPPIWLAGDRWYDRRKRKIAEAKDEEA